MVKNMKWSHPPIIKIYEALGAVADDRIEVIENTAKVYSSSRNKYYDVQYDPDKKAIMSNDNGSYWKGYLGYPAVAFLMKKKVISYDPEMGDLLKGVAWKDINQKFKNDFDKTLAYILTAIPEEKKQALAMFAQEVDSQIQALNLDMLGEKTLPPEGY